MNLEEIMTTAEKSVAAQLIITHLKLANAKLILADAQAEHKRVAKELTELWWETDEGGESVSAMPASFVIHYGSKPYLIEIDENGEHAHLVSLIGGILGNSPS